MKAATTASRTQPRFAADLRSARARSPLDAGAKASSLAIAAVRGLPTIPGFVITTAAHAAYLGAARTITPELADAFRSAWAALAQEGDHALVVRSSSTVEDTGNSSMAGQFTSVLDVRGWGAFLSAVESVMSSADRSDAPGDPEPMAVLVQLFVPAVKGGVMFGVDPVTGDRRHIVVEAVAGGPDQLVSGRVTAQHYVISRRGRAISVDQRSPRRFRGGSAGQLLHQRELIALARLAGRAQRAFGRPQDVEWAIDHHGRLVLLQSRPVTAVGGWAGTSGPVLGPGPVAETFPDPLGPLEVDLWIEPLRAGVVAALSETRAVARARLGRSPVITTVGGRVAADLELFGHVRRRRLLDALDPRPPLRHLAAAWRIGVLRADLPSRTKMITYGVDDQLSRTTIDGQTDEDVLGVLDACLDMLSTLHHHEVLAGAILPPATRTAAAVGMQVLERADPSMTDDELVASHPVLLSLAPPSLVAPVILPRKVLSSDGQMVGSELLPPREQLRLRIRWVQELTVRAVRHLGQRLHASDMINDPSDVALFSLAELKQVVRGGPTPTPAEMHERQRSLVAAAFAAPLPAQFRLATNGEVVPAARPGSRPGAGTGAGGGRGAGAVVHGSVRRPPVPGDVLVVRDLEPGLAVFLPGLAGLVAETGATLSHLAIMAREYGVPTVVAVHDARRRFPTGTRLLVDGATGELTVLDDGEPTGASDAVRSGDESRDQRH